jgi:hypothetical protein
MENWGEEVKNRETCSLIPEVVSIMDSISEDDASESKEFGCLAT